MRAAGVLMPVSALPSSYGVGDFGPSAYKFVDLIHEMKLKIWQVLPLNPLGYGNSPYQAYSSFAGDELYISLDNLVDDDLLSKGEAVSFNQNSGSVEYTAVRNHKANILKIAFTNFNKAKILRDEYNKFLSDSPWVQNYAVFIALKKANNLLTWNFWPEAHKNWIKDHALDLSPFEDDINYELFIQFIFFRQWFKLKNYTNKLGINIMGDIPIYIGFDSLDVWENQEIFLLNENQEPTFVAGVPPDFFSKTGQRWGNPLYDWEKLEATKFKFWIERLRINSVSFDMIRIDHFRAFDTYWKVPSSCPTAEEGEWVEAPGYKLFDTIYQELPEIKIVAEDLGDLRTEVLELRDHYKLHGMQIFQFIFDPKFDNSTLENTTRTIIYTGTHDNSTLMEWYHSLSRNKRQRLKKYFHAIDRSIKSEIIHYIMNCKAEYAIFPVQDIIGLDESARFNTPGQIGSPNWEWKLADFEQLEKEVLFIASEVTKSNR